MHSNPWDPYGDALLDYQHGDTSATIRVLSDFDAPADITVAHFFREPEQFPPVEQTALSKCRGRVLEIGAGAGCHALALQELGLYVCAIDINPQAVEVMAARGVRETHQADIFGFEGKGFDTLLMLMNGIGVVKNLVGLHRFFEHAKSLSEQDGQILMDSFDLSGMCSDAEKASREADSDRDYYGIVQYKWEYKGKMGEWFPWLYVDTDTLAEVASASGWHVEAIYRGEDNHYLGQLVMQ